MTDHVITLDFETYYDTKYNLRNVPTLLYVRDERFLVHGVGVQLDDEEPFWIDGPECAADLPKLPWDRATLVAHNTPFDGLVLREHYNLMPARYSDTMALGRAVFPGEPASLNALAERLDIGRKSEGLEPTKGVRELPADVHAQLIRYGLNDVRLTREIYLALMDRLPDEQHELIHMVNHMSIVPRIHIDLDRARRGLIEAQEERQRIIEASGLPKTTLSSNQKFAAWLEEQGIEPPMKWSAKQKQHIPALAKNDMGYITLKREHPELSHIWEARANAMSNNNITRIQRLIEMGETGPIPIPYNYYGAHTGRLSGRDKVNFQNMQNGSEARRSVCAPPGYVLGIADLSQIEARILAWLAGQDDLVEDFRRKVDIYSKMASRIYGRPIDRKKVPGDKTAGHVGKITILGLGYTMWIDAFQATLAMGAMGGPPVFFSLNECKEIILLYREQFHMIPRLWKFLESRLSDMVHPDNKPPASGFFAANETAAPPPYKCIHFEHEAVRLPNGMRLKYPNLRMKDGKFFCDRGGKTVKVHKGIITENIVQALANIAIQTAMLRINRRYPVVMQVHDEIISVIPEDEADEGLQFMIDTMRIPPEWAPDLPVDAEGDWAREYSK